MVQVRRVQEHYEIWVDGQFYCSCDNWTEVQEEVDEIGDSERLV